MSLGMSSADFTQVLNDLGFTVTYGAVTRTIDGIYGSETRTYSNSSKTWVFFKRESNTDLTKWGIVDIGDAYVIMPTTDSISYGDRVTAHSETYEYTPDCTEALRYSDDIAIFHWYTLRKVA